MPHIVGERGQSHRPLLVRSPPFCWNIGPPHDSPDPVRRSGLEQSGGRSWPCLTPRREAVQEGRTAVMAVLWAYGGTVGLWARRSPSMTHPVGTEAPPLNRRVTLRGAFMVFVIPGDPGGQGGPDMGGVGTSVLLEVLAGSQAPCSLLCLAAQFRWHPAVGHSEHVPPAGRGSCLPLLTQDSRSLQGGMGVGGAAPTDVAISGCQ